MSGESPSEQPFKAGNIPTNEAIEQAPDDYSGVATPPRAFYQNMTRDRSGIEPSAADPDSYRPTLRRRGSLQRSRRPSTAPDTDGTSSTAPPLQRYPNEDIPRNGSSSAEYYRAYHPDIAEREHGLSRAYRNEYWDRSDPGKPYVEERGDYGDNYRRIPDEEMAYSFGTPPKSQRMIDFNNLTKEERREVLRLPWTAWMDSDIKNHFVATLGEFVGTTMFLFFAFAATGVANIGSNASSSSSDTSGTTSGGATGFNVTVYLYISLAFGFSLMTNVWIFFRISGGLFNPAVTLGMVLVGAVPVVRALFLFVAQIAGSIAASGMVLGLFPTPFNVRTTLSGGASLVQGVFIEAFLTAELVFTIFMLAKEKHRATFIAPVGIGLALFIAELVGVYYTGGSLNPARSFGPCVVTGTFDPNHWIYWVGPGLGALIATVFYKFIKMLEYEMANPGQDAPDQVAAKRSAAAAEKHAERERAQVAAVHQGSWPPSSHPQSTGQQEYRGEFSNGAGFPVRRTSQVVAP